MDTTQILVAVTGTEADLPVMDAAITQAEREGAALVVVHTLPADTYDARGRTARATPALRADGYSYSLDQAVESATNVAERVAKTSIGERGIEYTAIGGPGEPLSATGSVATATNCSAVYLCDSRSWLDRLLDLSARRLRRAFDGTVVWVPTTVPVPAEPDIVPRPA